MASFNHISGAEPSTITFKAATVVQTRNSSAMHQELISLADPESSLAVAAILGAAPASTTYGLVVRPVGSVSVSQVSTVWEVQITNQPTVVAAAVIQSGNSSVFQASSAWQVQVTSLPTATIQGNSTVMQGTNPWTIAGNSTIFFQAGAISSAVLAGNSSALSVRNVWSSTNADQPVSAAQASTVWAVQLSQYSTIAAVSSVGGIVRMTPMSTVWASSAGFHFDSSGALQIAGSITATASTGPLTVSQLLDSSGGSVTAGDSANNALRVNVVAGAAGGSTIVTVSAFGAGALSSAVLAGNSSALTVRNVWSSTNADQPVSAAQSGTWTVQGNSTVFQGSSAWQVQVSNGNSSVTITAVAAGAGRLNIGSTAADNAVLISGNSSVFQGSSAWQVQVTNQARVSNSSAADFLATVTQSGTWNLNSITGLQSSVAPSSGSSGLIVRPVIDKILTTASSNAFTSSSFSIQSSGAGLTSYVVAYSITSTVQAPTKVAFYSSGTMIWPVVLGALSSAVTGVNLAVSAPAYLFATKAQSEALALQVGSSVAGFKVGVSYFRAP